jgi:hypothetical protein
LNPSELNPSKLNGLKGELNDQRQP